MIKQTMMAAVVALSTAGLGMAALPAQAETFVIDSTHVHTGFRISHLGFSYTLGQFRDISGTLEFDPENPSAGSVEVVIQTASVDTAHDKRDEHLRNADFFNVEQHPTMTFKSTAIEVTGEKAGKITGDLTMLGVTKPVVLDVTFNQMSPHPMRPENIVAGFSATGEINRTDFGMTYAAPAIGETVELTIEVEAVKQ